MTFLSTFITILAVLCMFTKCYELFGDLQLLLKNIWEFWKIPLKLNSVINKLSSLCCQYANSLLFNAFSFWRQGYILKWEHNFGHLVKKYLIPYKKVELEREIKNCSFMHGYYILNPFACRYVSDYRCLVSSSSCVSFFYGETRGERVVVNGMNQLRNLKNFSSPYWL